MNEVLLEFHLICRSTIASSSTKLPSAHTNPNHVFRYQKPLFKSAGSLISHVICEMLDLTVVPLTYGLSAELS